MIGQKIKARREQLGMSQRELADKTGMKQPNISSIEHGRMPTIPTLEKICTVLGLNMSDFFYYQGEVNSNSDLTWLHITRP